MNISLFGVITILTSNFSPVCAKRKGLPLSTYKHIRLIRSKEKNKILKGKKCLILHT